MSPPLHHLKSLSGHGGSEKKSENLTGHHSSNGVHEWSHLSESKNAHDRKLPARSSYRSRSRPGRRRLKIPGISGDTTPSPDAFKSLKLFTRRASFSISTCSIMGLSVKRARSVPSVVMARCPEISASTLVAKYLADPRHILPRRIRRMA